jgi:hypothetical protein
MIMIIMMITQSRWPQDFRVKFNLKFTARDGAAERARP